MGLHLTLLQTHGEITVQRTVIDHVTLDDLALVTQGDHKILVVVAGVVHHDVPQDRVTTNLHHWLGLDLRLFGQARAMTTGQNAYFHILSTPQVIIVISGRWSAVSSI